MGDFPPAAQAEEIGKRLVVSSNSLNGVFDDIWQLWGVAPADTARLDLRFQDGTTTTVPLHDGLFVYLIGGANCQAGHKPAILVAIDSSGTALDEAATQVSELLGRSAGVVLSTAILSDIRSGLHGSRSPASSCSSSSST